MVSAKHCVRPADPERIPFRALGSGSFLGELPVT
jgi:hypothetical protein